MGRDLTYTAREYGSTKERFPFRTEVERFTLFSLLGDVMGKRVLDAGCGEGVYSRALIDLGASYVLGVDGAQDFIDLAKQKNKGYEGKIEYVRSFIQDFQGDGNLDLVVGSYILSYPQSLEEAVEYCNAIASHLKEKGKFIGFNNNPFEVFRGSKYSKYGFKKEMSGNIEGEEVIYKLDGMNNPIINFYLNPETYEEAFRRAGFSQFRWQRVLLSPGEENNPYWDEFFDGEPPFIAMVAEK